MTFKWPNVHSFISNTLFQSTPSANVGIGSLFDGSAIFVQAHRFRVSVKLDGRLQLNEDNVIVKALAVVLIFVIEDEPLRLQCLQAKSM